MKIKILISVCFLLALMAWFFGWPHLQAALKPIISAEAAVYMAIGACLGFYILLNLVNIGLLENKNLEFVVPYLLCSATYMLSLTIKYNAGSIVGGLTTFLIYCVTLVELLIKPPKAQTKRVLHLWQKKYQIMWAVIAFVVSYIIGFVLWPKGATGQKDLTATLVGISGGMLSTLITGLVATGTISKSSTLLPLGISMASGLMLISNIGQYNPGATMVNIALILSLLPTTVKNYRSIAGDFREMVQGLK